MCGWVIALSLEFTGSVGFHEGFVRSSCKVKGCL